MKPSYCLTPQHSIPSCSQPHQGGSHEGSRLILSATMHDLKFWVGPYTTSMNKNFQRKVCFTHPLWVFGFFFIAIGICEKKCKFILLLYKNAKKPMEKVKVHEHNSAFGSFFRSHFFLVITAFMAVNGVGCGSILRFHTSA